MYTNHGLEDIQVVSNMLSEISGGRVEASKALIVTDQSIGAGRPGIRIIVTVFEFELCGKSEFIADVGWERILPSLFERPVVEGRGVAVG